MSIDTLEYVKTFENAGVERKVAEAHVKAISAHVVPELATRADLNRVEHKLEQKIETMVQRMEATVVESRNRHDGRGARCRQLADPVRALI